MKTAREYIPISSRKLDLSADFIPKPKVENSSAKKIYPVNLPP